MGFKAVLSKPHLGEVGEEYSDRMEAPEGLLAILPELDAADELCEEDQVQNDGGCQEGVLAGVVDGQRVAPAHEDLRDVLIHGPLGVSHGGDILDHHHMVRVLACISHHQISVPDSTGVSNGAVHDMCRADLGACTCLA